MTRRLTPAAALLPLLYAATPASLYAAPTLNDVVVTATRQPTKISDALMDVTIIDTAEIRRAGPITTVGELLGRQPGIEFRQSGAAGATSSVSIRGSNTNHVLLLVDGARVGSITNGAPTWEALPLEQIERIEIIRGPASSLYGADAIGGVVQIFTRRGEGAMRPTLEAGYGTDATSALSAGLSGSHDAWRYALQVSDKRSDGFSAINNPKNAAWNPDRDGYQLSSSSGSLAYALSKEHELGLNFLYSDGWNRFDSGSRFSTPPADDYKMKETVKSLSLTSRNQWTELWSSTLRASRSTDDNRNLDNGRQTALFRSIQTQYQWQNDLRLPVGTALLGIEHLEQRIDSDNNYTAASRSINSLLAGWGGRLGAHNLQLNVRQDENSQFGDKTTGLAAYGYQLNNEWRGNLSWGTAFKAPSFNDLYYPADAWGNVSNPNLRPETAENHELALHYETAQHHVSLTGYRNKVKNLIQWAPIDPSFITSSGYTPSNVASATLTGATLAYAGKLADYTLSGSVDWQNPKDDSLGKTLIYRAKNTAKLALEHRVGSFDLGGEWQATSKRYTNTANTQQLGGYSLLNLTARYHLNQDWSIYARANNVFNRKYTLVKDFGTPEANLFIGVRYAPR